MDRYDIRTDEEPDGTGWTVYDVQTGEIARVNDLPMVGLRFVDAHELAEILNRSDRQRRTGPTH